MKRLILAALATLLASSAVAQQFSPPGQPFGPAVLRLGDHFKTLLVSCGTPINPDCPRVLDPLAGPALLHYITLGGRSTSNCSGWLFVERAAPTGTERIELIRLVLAAGATDNMVLTLPKPIRLEAGDAVGITVAQGTCAVLADVAIEPLN